MGEPDEVWTERIHDLTPYKVTKDVMKNAGEKAIFLHCLPAFHDLKTKIGKEMGERFNLTDMEVTDEVFESEQSKEFDEAENNFTGDQYKMGGQNRPFCKRNRFYECVDQESGKRRCGAWNSGSCGISVSGQRPF